MHFALFLFYPRVNWMKCRQLLLFCIHTIALLSHKIFSRLLRVQDP